MRNHEWNTSRTCTNCGALAGNHYSAAAEIGCWSCDAPVSEAHCYYCCPVCSPKSRAERGKKTMAKLAKDKFLVYSEDGKYVGIYDDQDAANRAASDVVTREDRSYGSTVFVLKPITKVSRPTPAAEISDLSK